MKTESRRTLILLVLAPIALGATICSPSVEEPGSAWLPVQTQANGLPSVTNDLDWTVELTAFRLAIRDIEFTTGGETHARAPGLLSRWLLSRALAHPGHYAGGEVTGELAGEFLVDPYASEPLQLGEAELLTGDYNGFNFYFRRATDSDQLSEGDPLLGHTAFLQGTATQSGQRIEFTAVIDVDENTQMVGGPFDLDVVSSSSQILQLEVHSRDPAEQDTLFDGLDFGLLDENDDGVTMIEPGLTAHNLLMKTLIRHDHYGMEVL